MKLRAIITEPIQRACLRGARWLTCGLIFMLVWDGKAQQKQNAPRPATNTARPAPVSRPPAANTARPAQNTARQGNVARPTTSNPYASRTSNQRTTNQQVQRTPTQTGQYGAGAHGTQPRANTQPAFNRPAQNSGANGNAPRANTQPGLNRGPAQGAGGLNNRPASAGNNRPGAGSNPPRGPVTHLAGGGTRETLSNGGSLNRDRGGRPMEYHNAQTGVHANFDRNGRVSQISKVTPNGAHMNIQRGPGNVRRIESVRTVHGGVERMVSYGHNRGFYERPIEGRPGYMQRTVVVNGHVYAGVYRHYYYHGIYLNSPVPAVVFAPAYYGWLLSPWPARFAYSPAYWGWAGQPWYGYYSPYFTPYPTYAGPEQWLTDYVIASNLQQAYQDQQQTQNQQDASAPPPVPITDEEKALMAQDIRNDLARQKDAAANNASANNNAPAQDSAAAGGATASSATPEALQDHLFTVYAAPIEAKLTTGESCHLTEGDMLYRQSDAPDANNTVDVIVKGSHADEGHPDFCARQTQVKVQIADLQDMYIHKHELLAEGMQKQADLVGKKHGVPNGPKANPSKVPGGQASPDEEAVAELKKQIMDGDDAEKEVSSTNPPVS